MTCTFVHLYLGNECLPVKFVLDIECTGKNVSLNSALSRPRWRLLDQCGQKMARPDMRWCDRLAATLATNVQTFQTQAQLSARLGNLGLNQDAARLTKSGHEPGYLKWVVDQLILLAFLNLF